MIKVAASMSCNIYLMDEVTLVLFSTLIITLPSKQTKNQDQNGSKNGSDLRVRKVN